MRRPVNEERGAVSSLVSLLMMALVPIVFVMVVGLGQLRLLRMEIQRAADLAVLAGIQQLDFRSLIEGGLVLNKPSAEEKLRQVLEANLAPLAPRLNAPPGQIAAIAEVATLNVGDLRPYSQEPATTPEVWVEVEAPVSWLGGGIGPSTVRVVSRAVVCPP